MLSWQVGRVKITRIVEMDLPVPATVIPQATPGSCVSLRGSWTFGDDDREAAAVPTARSGLRSKTATISPGCSSSFATERWT
jgi:hypothetical protein